MICASDEDRRTKTAAPTLQKATTTAFHDDVGLGSAVWAWRTLWLMMGTVGAYGRHLQKLTRLQAVLSLRRKFSEDTGVEDSVQMPRKRGVIEMLRPHTLADD